MGRLRTEREEEGEEGYVMEMRILLLLLCCEGDCQFLDLGIVGVGSRRLKGVFDLREGGSGELRA